MTHFINKSGETIPPFACMQICIPPEKWEEIQKLPLTDATKQLMINGGLINAFDLPRYEQDTVLYCIKPNLVTAIWQDPPTLAFNGPSFVEPNKQGVCSIGEYPAKALASSFTYPYAALGPSPNSWRLGNTFAEFGAFRPLHPTTHEVKRGNLSPIPGENARQFVQFVSANNYKKATFPMNGKGIIFLRKGDCVLNGTAFLGDWQSRFRSEMEPYFLLYDIGSAFNTGMLVGSKIAWFRDGVIQFPGVYEIRIAGRLAIKDAPENIETVPISLKLLFKPDDGNTQSYETFISGADIELNIDKYVETTVPLVKKWPEMAFRTRYFVRYLGKKGRFVLENNSSPYAQVAVESKNLTFDIRRLRWSEGYDDFWASYRNDLFHRPFLANPEFGMLYNLDVNRDTQIMFFRT